MLFLAVNHHAAVVAQNIVKPGPVRPVSRSLHVGHTPEAPAGGWFGFLVPLAPAQSLPVLAQLEPRRRLETVAVEPFMRNGRDDVCHQTVNPNPITRTDAGADWILFVIEIAVTEPSRHMNGRPTVPATEVRPMMFEEVVFRTTLTLDSVSIKRNRADLTSWKFTARDACALVSVRFNLNVAVLEPVISRSLEINEGPVLYALSSANFSLKFRNE